jgi:N-ethylmaleimide reductase
MKTTTLKNGRSEVVQTILMTSVRLGPYTLPNRIVMAPLTRNRAGTGNVPQAMNVEYYSQRASAGLIISEATQVSPQGVGYPSTPGSHTPAQVQGWKKVTRAVHQRGGRIFLQLWHVGRISHPSLQPNGSLPVAPSAIKPEGEAYTYQGLQPFVTPRALETEEITGIIEQYRVAAQNALEVGFDGVEIHSANGYLLDQFLRDGTNHRTDAYGGSVENRARLLLEVTEAVTNVWGADRVGVRISPVHTFNSMYDSQPHLTFGYVAKQLNRFGLAYLHVVESRYGDGAYPVKSAQAFDDRLLRDAFQGTYMANAGYDRNRALAALEADDADLIAFGALFIANPDLPLRLAWNAPLNVPDVSTFYGGGEKGYTDYPFLNSEISTKILSEVA